MATKACQKSTSLLINEVATECQIRNIYEVESYTAWMIIRGVLSSVILKVDWNDMQSRVEGQASNWPQVFQTDRHSKWKNDESRNRQYMCYVYICAKRGLPKSECRNTAISKGYEYLIWQRSFRSSLRVLITLTLQTQNPTKPLNTGFVGCYATLCGDMRSYAKRGKKRSYFLY